MHHVPTAGVLIRGDGLSSGWTLGFASTNRLVAPPIKLSIVGNCTFAVAAADIWNDVISADSLFGDY